MPRWDNAWEASARYAFALSSGAAVRPNAHIPEIKQVKQVVCHILEIKCQGVIGLTAHLLCSLRSRLGRFESFLSFLQGLRLLRKSVLQSLELRSQSGHMRSRAILKQIQRYMISNIGAKEQYVEMAMNADM